MCQEMGRVGRDGYPAECVTIFWPENIEETGWIKRGAERRGVGVDGRFGM